MKSGESINVKEGKRQKGEEICKDNGTALSSRMDWYMYVLVDLHVDDAVHRPYDFDIWVYI